jgi:hypothetical protein
MDDDGTNFVENAQTVTEDAEAVFAVLPISAQGEDYLFMVNGTENLMYEPQTPQWTTIGASSPTGCSYAVEHENRLYLIKNAQAYFSGLRANSWDQNTDVLNFDYRGELIKCAASFNGDLVVFRQNSIAVMRGGDPYSGLILNPIVKKTGTLSPKTVIEGRYRGKPVLYFLSQQGRIEAFDGYSSKVIDNRIDLSGLIDSSYLANAAAGLYKERYLVLAYTQSGSTTNDAAIVYDTQDDRFISNDTGYTARCFWNTSGGSDKGELYFGTVGILGRIYTFDSGTVDQSDDTTTGTTIPMIVKTGEMVAKDPTQQVRLRGLKITVDLDAGTDITATVGLNDDTSTHKKTFIDGRTAYLWGSVAQGGSGLRWGSVDQGGSGGIWGTGELRRTFNWNIPQSIDPFSYTVQIENDANKTLRLFALEVFEKQRTPK